MAPEYSGLWRQDTWQLPGATRFYWYLPSLLTAMEKGQTIELPAAAFGASPSPVSMLDAPSISMGHPSGIYRGIQDRNGGGDINIWGQRVRSLHPHSELPAVALP